MIYDGPLPVFSPAVASRALVLRYVLRMCKKWLGSVPVFPGLGQINALVSVIAQLTYFKKF